MAGTAAPSGDLQNRKQIILDYLSDHIDQARSADELAEATGMPIEEAMVAVEALAYEQEVAKERTEGGQPVYRRKP